MKNKLFTSLAVTLLAATPLVSFAVLDSLRGMVEQMINIIYVVIVLVFSLAVVVFGWGIVKYLTAAGDAGKLKAARGFLWWGVLGMFVLAAIAGIVLFIGQSLGINTSGGGTIHAPNVEY